MENIKPTVSREAVDKALECLDGHPAICWNCIKEHYPEEYAKRRSYYAYRRRCDACGVKTECGWSSVWRILIFPYKTTPWLISRFEKDLAYYINAPSLAAEASASMTLVHRGKDTMTIILEYLEKQNPTPEMKKGWSHFFFWYALQYKVVPHDPSMPKNYDEWVPVLKKFMN